MIIEKKLSMGHARALMRFLMLLKKPKKLLKNYVRDKKDQHLNTNQPEEDKLKKTQT